MFQRQIMTFGPTLEPAYLHSSNTKALCTRCAINIFNPSLGRSLAVAQDEATEKPPTSLDSELSLFGHTTYPYTCIMKMPPHGSSLRALWKLECDMICGEKQLSK
jgi:hypothetical protein